MRPTSHDGGGLVFRVERAATSSILCHNLASIALDKGEVGRVLEETRTHITCHMLSLKSRAVTCSDSGHRRSHRGKEVSLCLLEAEAKVTCLFVMDCFKRP